MPGSTTRRQARISLGVSYDGADDANKLARFVAESSRFLSCNIAVLRDFESRVCFATLFQGDAAF